MSGDATAPSNENAPSRLLPVRAPRVPRVVHEFQPDALEIERVAPSRVAHLSLITIVVMIIAFVAWGLWAQSDIVISGRGKLITPAGQLVVGALDTSIIRSLEAKVGDRVKQGEVLALLDPTFTEADVAQLMARKGSLTAELERLEAEISGTEPFADAAGALSPEQLLQKSIYRQRMSTYAARSTAHEERMREMRTSVSSIEEEQALLLQRLDLLQDIQDMRAELVRKEAGSRLNLLGSQNDRLRAAYDLQRAQRDADQLKHKIVGAEAEMAAWREEWETSTAENLLKVRRELNDVSEHLAKASRRQELSTLRSPADGIVLEVADRSIGSVVREAEVLYTLVPDDAELEVEAEIRSRDIGYLRQGNPARIKLEAFPFQRHGVLKGEVRTISGDSFETKTPFETELFYRVRIAITANELRNLPDRAVLLPGMSGQAEIKVGDRSVISYFLYPFTKAIDESLREP